MVGGIELRACRTVHATPGQIPTSNVQLGDRGRDPKKHQQRARNGPTCTLRTAKLLLLRARYSDTAGGALGQNSSPLLPPLQEEVGQEQFANRCSSFNRTRLNISLTQANIIFHQYFAQSYDLLHKTQENDWTIILNVWEWRNGSVNAAPSNIFV